MPTMTKEEAISHRCDVSFQEVSEAFGVRGVCNCGVFVIWHKDKDVVINRNAPPANSNEVTEADESFISAAPGTDFVFYQYKIFKTSCHINIHILS